MKIIVLTPLEHFHAPIVIKALRERLSDDEIIVVTTPKLPGRGGFSRRVSRLVKQSGCDYLFSMLITKLCFSFRRIIERFSRTGFQKRNYLTVTDVIKHFRLRHYHFKNINHRKNVSLLASYKPDIILVVFFNQILKEPIMQIPTSGCINLHPAYLPAYRGFSPCFWALVNNEDQSGVSLHYVTEQVDMGPIIRQVGVPIHPSDSFFSLYRRCAEAGAGLLGNIAVLCRKKVQGKTQDETKASCFGPITPSAVRRFRHHQRRFGWLV